ncbi:exonuclease domain-containing protein [Urechidicola croceus]|uniref:DNA polymerase III subunit epsilon n=1 Tax=Urechidicola croceus TaxID=1850246 RepID=A0A1D8P509_9FLAO|nr:exonuclease domain-containing protein [Urechidicola croceus]AOW19670.1 DNA polymerase III subunit epsilon [Urechidicola croceus]
MYAILDIETTGGKYNEEGITEIAIYKYDGHKIVDQLITLVNPERDIQPFVERLTGINATMLKSAPKFYDIAKRIIELTTDSIIVAHNATFDYRILRTEFRRLGYDFERKTLCTVELTKELIPDLKSYSLGKLCKTLCIPVSNRHRAEGDALATVKLFKMLIDKDSKKIIIKSNIKNGIDRELAPKFQLILDSLPSSLGLYYVHDDKGNILYIGKGNDIKKSVNKLFLKTSKKVKLLHEILNNVSYENTGNELISNLKYHNEVLLNKPKFNYYYPKKVAKIKFSNNNLLLIDKGRNINEKSVILIEDNKLLGYCYVDLEYQINNLEILKSLVSTLGNNSHNRFIIKNHLLKHKVEKIIRF